MVLAKKTHVQKFIDTQIMESNSREEAKKIWDSFRKDVMFKQRFFLTHPLLDKLKIVAKNLEMTISPGKIYYRARIIDDLAAKELMLVKCYREGATEEERKWYRNKANKFRGLSKEGSYVPTDPTLIRDARSNPKFIRYLYMAESPTTAVHEVRPILYGKVNVAGIEVKEQLHIANIAVDIDFNPEKEKSIDEWLLAFVQTAFSSPTNNSDDYIPSQIIAEFFRHLGYDGIRYSSSLHKGGYNLTVYDVSKCEAVFSTDMRLDDMKISLRPAFGAENVYGGFHYIKDNVPMRWDKEKGELVEAKI